MTVVAAMSGVPFTLQDAATTGAGNVVCPPMSFRNHTFTIATPTGVSAGAIQIESSDDPTYTGTWVAQGSPIVAVASAEVGVSIVGIFTALRARVSTTISGGGAPSVTVKYLGGKNF